MPRQDYGTGFFETASAQTTALATHAAETGKIHYITDIGASSDKQGAIMTVKIGSTTVYEVQLATTAAGINAFEHSFVSPLFLASGVGTTVSISVDNTTIGKVNISGFTI